APMPTPTGDMLPKGQWLKPKPASTKACRETTECKTDATCTFDPVVDDCAVRSSADCQRSDLCATEARCTYDSAGGCELRSSADCKLATSCTTGGGCVYSPNALVKCLPASDQHCLASTNCKTEGICRFEKVGLGGFTD